jgi:hypothetical protein
MLFPQGAFHEQKRGRERELTRRCEERDIPFCGGNCNVESEAANGEMLNVIQMSELSFPKASVFNATIVPNAGHGLNYQYSHPFTYATILDFFKTNAK